MINTPRRLFLSSDRVHRSRSQQPRYRRGATVSSRCDLRYETLTCPEASDDWADGAVSRGRCRGSSELRKRWMHNERRRRRFDRRPDRPRTASSGPWTRSPIILCTGTQRLLPPPVAGGTESHSQARGSRSPFRHSTMSTASRYPNALQPPNRSGEPTRHRSPRQRAFRVIRTR